MFDKILRSVSGYWDSFFRLDCHSSIWVEQEELGKTRVIEQRKKRYRVKIPKEFNRKVVVRLRGIGNARGSKTGDLFLHMWLNKGEDVTTSLWLPETLAREGGNKKLVMNGRRISMVIPPNSHSGLTIRLRGLGNEAIIPIRDPLLRRNRGDGLVKLFAYPETITPSYGHFGILPTEVMAQEGWIYRAIDEVINRMGRASFASHPIQAGEIAERFNEYGWLGLYRTLVNHLELKNLGITIAASGAMSLPGRCQRHVQRQNDVAVTRHYQIEINTQYLENPFSVAAILAHELCHVVYAEQIADRSKSDRTFEDNQATWDEERTVDLLVCMFGMGEFRLRFARDSGLSLGYFDPVSFERMQLIVSRRLSSI